MQELTILDLPHQTFSVRLGGFRTDFDLHYNQLCDRWFLQVSLEDVCLGSFKIINDSRLMRACAPDFFGDFIALSSVTATPGLGRHAFRNGHLKLYYATPQESFLLGYNGY